MKLTDIGITQHDLSLSVGNVCEAITIYQDSAGLTDTTYRFREKLKLVLKATRQHARNLATFAVIYKASLIVLRNISPAGSGKEGRYDSFFAGLLGGYVVFGRQPGSVSQQVRIST